MRNEKRGSASLRRLMRLATNFILLGVGAFSSVHAAPIPTGGVLLWEEGFDGYAQDSYIGGQGGWTPEYNAIDEASEWLVTASQFVSAAHSLHVYGSHRGCWSGSVFRAVSGGHLLMTAQIRAAGEAGLGCHKTDVRIDFINQSAGDWGTQLAGVAIRSAEAFERMQPGLVCETGSDDVGTQSVVVDSYANSLSRWIPVAIEIDPSAAAARFWTDGVYRGELPIDTSIPVAHVRLGSGDGAGWVDDVRIYELVDASATLAALATPEVNPGDPIRYTLSVTSGSVTAEDVMIDVPLVNATMVSGSLEVRP